MAFNVAIQIQGENRAGAALREAEGELRRLGQTAQRVAPAGAAAARGTQAVANAAKAARTPALGLSTAVSVLATQLGAVSGAGSVAGTIIASTFGLGLRALIAPTGILAIGLVGLTAAVLKYKSGAAGAAEEQKKFNEAIKAGDIEFFTKRLREADEQLEKIQKRQKELRGAAEGAIVGGGPSIFGIPLGAVTAEERALQLSAESAKAKNDRVAELAAQEKAATQAFREATIELERQAARIGLTEKELIDLSHAERIAEAMTKGLALASDEAQRAFVRASRAIRDRTQAVREAAEAEKKLQEGIQQAREIGRGIDALGGPAGVAFENKLRGVFDRVNDLFKQRAEFGFLTDVLGVEQAKRDLAELGQGLERKFGAEVPVKLESLRSTIQSALRNLELSIDTSGAEQNVNELQAKLDALRRDAERPLRLGGGGVFGQSLITPVSGGHPIVRQPTLNFNATVSGSPTLPFSDYFERYAPRKLRQFSDEASRVAIDFGSNLSSVLSAFAPFISSQLTRLAEVNRVSSLFGTPAARGLTGLSFESAGTQRKSIRENLDFILKLATLAGGGGGSFATAGGGGGNTFILDLRDAVITTQELEKSTIPKFEEMIKRATGQSAGLRVLS